MCASVRAPAGGFSGETQARARRLTLWPFSGAVSGGMDTLDERVERIGRYEVLRQISSGRLAELFVAKQVGAEGFAKVVCIRRIHDELASDAEFVKSFLDEARL